MIERALSPREAAGVLLLTLQQKGATFTLTADGDLRANLDLVPFPMGNCDPEQIATLLLALAPEIKAILRDVRIH